jgi:hypothetical protein
VYTGGYNVGTVKIGHKPLGLELDRPQNLKKHEI